MWRSARSGLRDLPPNSLIDLTHKLSDFVKPVYDLIKADVLNSRVLRADETPHKMLEGSITKSWYLWGFSNPKSCYLECHDTRSGDVASEVLLNGTCEVLVTDVYSGYGRAIKEVNKIRLPKSIIKAQSAYCNIHARRYFFKSQKHKETEFYLDHCHEIYKLESKARGQPPDVVLELRSQMASRFEAMREIALAVRPRYSDQSKFAKAMNYFTSNYDGLTLFLKDPEVPIDNNPQERLFRSHVVGRKTWYGTHSERGAKTASILFSLVESCKLNQVNPRGYFSRIHLIYQLP